jgi:hypothetical protein
MVFRQQTHLPIVVSAALHHNQSFTPTTTTTISKQASNTIQKEMREDGESVRSTNSGAQTDKTTGSMEGGLRGFGRGQHSVKQKTLGSEISRHAGPGGHSMVRPSIRCWPKNETPQNQFGRAGHARPIDAQKPPTQHQPHFPHRPPHDQTPAFYLQADAAIARPLPFILLSFCC